MNNTHNATDWFTRFVGSITVAAITVVAIPITFVVLIASVVDYYVLLHRVG